ncbi:CASP8 and FADD-like apoptosis regulator isoform X1 [Anas acuta]|uniref:CASP8 and FADD like apoptosis regulator n=4 Tax=Anas platyrhynchos TaxID=8839 RepID=U3J6Q0_ANAPP|nr:CASP8 and FADD-like apoptosis regulator isoform X1 [Anas platyrhynchos]XP_012950196.1 CASP8 and FADD-like apoptosis regulator isoform X1 [Anas platyrhynchos]XP_012950198.1 CASP8 and FADD-like apoptosis regulator isoform X1 [Anas platyrhynchos]XP_012950200.1 CASP8 and FADD-like apoptosis regulator isoform X1 [Anas platyrhynchos]XP_012950201.1 CASP8 and FADD-like apoptosis regulator isoform X1 [Anas platyrhynchos]XP_038038061.1 CASP8 and FADD-like apoptosis regulator isoform X1 [Anas platyrhy|eukprot:XP_012950195.1 CASP8 and FADD-like apoptosis regulator isoform X1 [Anas platyrhynchos]
MTKCQVPAVLIHQIVEELDKEEGEIMVFLCRDLVPDLATADLRELLMALNEREKLSLPGLSELLYRVKRFDLLRRILKTEKITVEFNLARSPRLVPDYRVLMVEINENLEKEEVGSLVFLLRDYAPRMKLAKDKSFLALVIDLEKLNLVAPNQLDLIEECFQSIHRIDLIKKIKKYKQEAFMSSVPSQPVYVNALQASLPNLSLIDPPYNSEIQNVNKEKSQNGQSFFQEEPVHMSIQESGPASHKVFNDQYRMQSQPLGICLIIDCIGNDTDVLEETFRGLGYDVHCHRHLDMDAMNETLLEAAGLQKHRNCDSFVCILVSRGSPQSIFCTDQTSTGFPLEQIKKYFMADSCPELRGKPKLFFIQSYIVPENEQECTSLLEIDGNDDKMIANAKIPLKGTIPQVADVFWSQCKVDVSTIEKSPTSSSYYLRCLAELLRNPHKRKQSILDIHTELNRKVYEWNKTMDPSQQYSLLLQHTLRKKLFLSPT